MILKTSIKYWPAEYHSQSAIEAALFIRNQITDLSKVKSMVIESHDASVDIIGSEPEKWKPRQRETADHSLPYITAVALIDGEVTDKQFEPSRFTEEKIVAFLPKVEVKRNDELSALYAEAVANIVHVTLTDGQTLTKRVDYPLGNAKNRLKDEEVEGKFLNLAAPKLGREACDPVLQFCWQLDQAVKVDDLMKACVMNDECD
jgi:2-methylcitrate dehydratase